MPYKLFVFAIGGTGSRVVKSLTMLLASGVNLGEVSAIIPIFIDPHKTNKDLLRTEDLLRTYQRIRGTLGSKPLPGEFFSTEIKSLENVTNKSNTPAETFTYKVHGGDKKFGQYIDYTTLDPANKALAALLFSESNRNTEMNIGFVGNPNIGSVVLNQFGESNELKDVAANFDPNDRIFIISSIFGGTGAAGFPVILKNIRNALTNEVLKKQNPEHFRNARIGALTAMPYFTLKTEVKESNGPNKQVEQIESPMFVGKTKAALHYYEREVNHLVNRLYYIGDDVKTNYEYDPGSDGQRNNAHFVELASALAIVHFARLPDTDLTTADAKPEAPAYVQFSIREKVENVSFKHLYEPTLLLIARPLTRLALFSIYLTDCLQEAAGKTNWTLSKPLIDKGFVGSSFVSTHLKLFNGAFRNWIHEQYINQRSFRPFGMDDKNQLVGHKSLSRILADYSPKQSLLERVRKKPGTITIEDIDGELNLYTKSHPQFRSAEEKLLQAMSHSLDILLTDKFPDFFNPKNIPSDI